MELDEKIEHLADPRGGWLAHHLGVWGITLALIVNVAWDLAKEELFHEVAHQVETAVSVDSKARLASCESPPRVIWAVAP